MKHRPEHETGGLPPETEGALSALRERRNFDPENYLSAKSAKLNEYMSDAGLSSCVVAVSGGIDSAAVLAMVKHAADQPDSPIEKIYPVALPIYHDEFTKNQDEATARGRELCEALGLDLIEIDLTKAFDSIKSAVDSATGVTGEPWAAGQLVAYLRTPANYYTTSLTSQQEHPGILVGTTNRDEGAYLGYVGKASDGIVDVQLISDLHKSEVRAVSRHLGVPASIMDATPTGDMFDGRVDEEVFGATYDYVELFLALKSLDPREAEAITDRLGPSGRDVLETAFANLEALHDYNAHKYKVGSPAVHLDVLESGVPGGWPYSSQKVGREPQGAEHFVNPFSLSGGTRRRIYGSIATREFAEREIIEVPKGEVMVIHNAVPGTLIDHLLDDADNHGWVKANIFGSAKDFKEGDEVGSLRASTFSAELSDYLWGRVAPHLANPRQFDDDPQVNIAPRSIWRPIGVSPLHRFIGYEHGNFLVPHYDEIFAYSPDIMTLKSLVLYLESSGIKGGATRFLRDDRLDVPVWRRDLSDRQELATVDQVIARVDPEPGSILVFDHSLLHDAEGVEPIDEDGRKVILRTDVVYAKC